MKLSKEVKTGLLAIVAIALLIFGYSFLKGESLLSDDRTFYAVYDDVEGLAPSSNVTINGLEVGKVLSIEFTGTSGNLLVTFNLKNNFQFSKDSEAQIYGGGLIGGKSLAIVPNYSSSEAAKSGDTLKGTIDEGIFELVNDRLTPLQKKVESVIGQTDSVLVAVNDVLDPDTRQNLRTAIESLTQTTASFNSASQALNGLLTENRSKLNRTFTNLDHMSGNFKSISDSVAQLEIGQLTNNMQKVISDFEQVSTKLNSNEGTVGKLINDDQLYNNLELATKQMQELMQDIKLNPKRYVHFSVFGKNPGSYEKPEDSLR